MPSLGIWQHSTLTCFGWYQRRRYWSKQRVELYNQHQFVRFSYWSHTQCNPTKQHCNKSYLSGGCRCISVVIFWSGCTSTSEGGFVNRQPEIHPYSVKIKLKIFSNPHIWEGWISNSFAFLLWTVTDTMNQIIQSFLSID